MQSPFASVPEALEEFARGRMVVVVDDEDRENEGDLTLAADYVTPEAINFMARFGRGLICLTLTEEHADRLELRPMTQVNTSRFGTAFTESIEAREGVTTGISAHDRAHTIRVAVRQGVAARDLARPGHVFPLRARDGGVLVRAGQTEASVDLARMAGLSPAGVICEIMNEDGTMARLPDLVRFCTRFDLKMLSVAELIRYRLRTENLLQLVGESDLQTRLGVARMLRYQSAPEPEAEHTVLVFGQVAGAEPVPVYIHAQCQDGDVFASTGCDCRRRLDESFAIMGRHGRGVLLYLRSAKREPEGCAGHLSQLHANYCRQVLAELGVARARLLTRERLPPAVLQGLGLEHADCLLLHAAPGMAAVHLAPAIDHDSVANAF
jgi:3,4-dihydroxy 2-butanone 4-phosphate synthase / GTP cyclohydrolase II